MFSVSVAIREDSPGEGSGQPNLCYIPEGVWFRADTEILGEEVVMRMLVS